MIFTLDGRQYNVHVTALTRKFAVLDTQQSGRTLDGRMYRSVIGTFYNYTMTVEASAGDSASLEALWEAVSQPAVSHVCTFPYGQKNLTQRMYITSGEQPLQRIHSQGRLWGALTLEFIAMEPEVMP